MKYEQIVYLKTDPEQLGRMITGKLTRPGLTLWELSCGTEVSIHNEMEITEKPKELKKVKGF